MRKYRKKEHIENCLKARCCGDTLLGDIMLIHQALPELDFNDIDTGVEFLGRRIELPIMINAITGGVDFSDDINVALAKLSEAFKIPMAVGSQTIAVNDIEAQKSFELVREHAPNSLIIGNINAFVEATDAKKMADCIKADAMQIHINPAQELAQCEGDRTFKGVYDKIAKLKEALDIPLIVKEVGFGMSTSAFSKLQNLGVDYVDVSGYGGTNFIEVEDLRCEEIDFSDLYEWGIPTAFSIAECAKLSDRTKLIASGGIKESIDVARVLRLGAHIAAVSGELLKYVVHGGYDNAYNYLRALSYKLKMIMVLTGSKDIEQLRHCDARITGRLKELLDESSKL